jgi:hypothetical protein
MQMGSLCDNPGWGSLQQHSHSAPEHLSVSVGQQSLSLLELENP